MRYAGGVTDQPTRPLPTENAAQASFDGAGARPEAPIDLAHLGHLQRLAAAGLLSAGFVHNLANLLVPISTLCERALLSDEPEAHHRALVTTAEHALQAAELTRTYLDFVRRDQSQPADVPVISVVEKALALLQQEFQFAGVALIRNFDGNHVARIDRTRLLQILLNLIKNAIRAARDGGHTVTVRIRGHRDRVTVEVDDDGPGIEPDVVDRLFEPFVHGRQSESAQGDDRRTGLGLFIARKLAEEQGAGIRFRTTPGEGTIFSIVLMEARAAAARQRAEADGSEKRGSCDS
jgi:signal transduction histidine kinase